MNDFEMLYPHSAEAEQSVIGSMLIDPRCINDVVGKLTEDDFYLELNRDVFEAIVLMHSQDMAIDPVTVIDKLKACGRLRRDTQTYILELMQVTPTAANVMKYVEILVTETMRRRLQATINEALEQIGNGEQPQNICSYIQNETTKIAEAQTSAGLTSSLAACSDFYNYIDTLSDSTRKPYVRSGYGQLDYVLGGGFQNEGLYIIAARPGCGKTTIGVQIADKVAASGIPTLFMTLEMSKNQITAKRIAIETGINYNKVLNGELYGDEFKNVGEACAKLSEYPMVINRKFSATVDEIGFLAHQVPNLGLVVIDYLGMIRNNSKGSLYEKTTETSNNLKRLARALGVPVICLAQLNREVEGRNGGKPRMSDLRDSGAIEQDADGILLLSRNMDEAQDDSFPTELICTVGKNRHGRTGEVRFNFYLTNGRIRAVKE